MSAFGWRMEEVLDVYQRPEDATRPVVCLDETTRQVQGEVRTPLPSHSPASLDEAFAPAETKRLADKLEIHSTPTHGSWLDMAELELSVLQRQCLDRRLGDRATMATEVAAWVAARNAAAASIDWRFTTADARIKLGPRHPVFQE